MTSTETQDEEESGKKPKAFDALRRNSLRAAGVSFLLADSSLIAFGRFSGENSSPNMVAAGAFGLTAGAVGTIFGHQRAERQLQQLYQDLSDHLHQHGVAIPTNIHNPMLTRKGGFFDKIQSFLYAHPSEVMNVLYSMVGGAFIREGMQHNIRNLKISGSMLIGGALGGILIKEKKPDPANPPQGAFQKAVSWVQEKPLRVTGTLFNLNQVFLGMSAFEYRKRQLENKSYLFVLLAVAAFTFGNIMMMITPKKRDGDKKLDLSSMNALADTSAQIIAAQPDPVKAALLDDISTYLSSKPNAPLQKEELSQLLITKLAEIERHPRRGSWQGRVTGMVGPSLQPVR